jgi:hypothetical protein
MIHSAARRLFLIAAVLVSSAFLFLAARADYIYLNDGFVLEGKILKQYDYIDDGPTGMQIAISKFGGFYIVDDNRIRRIYFPTKLVAGTDHIDRKFQLEQFDFKPADLKWFPTSKGMPGYAVESVADWNANGTRNLNVIVAADKGNAREVEQKIDTLTPYGLEVKSKYFLNHRSSYLTREFSPDKILEMVRYRAKADAKDGKMTMDDQLRIVRFAAQAGWLDRALAELKGIAQQYPSELERLAQVRLEIKKSQIKVTLEELEDAIQAGQHGRAQSILANIDEEGADAQELTKISTLKAKYKQQNADLERVRKLFTQRRQAIGMAPLVSQFGSLLDEIDRDLNLDNAEHLSVFLKLAEQEDRFAAKGQPPILTAAQQLALAITGWLSGPNGAEKDPESAAKLARGREFLQKFLTTDDPGQRDSMVAHYLQKEPLRVDEITQLIEELPPPRAEPITKPILDLVTQTTGAWPEGVKYRLYLPPEYHHHRAYPLLFLIPNLGQTYETATNGWLEPAARKGFIIAVPEWAENGQDRYKSSDKEHEAVLEVLRDLRRRFRIDNNRVCMTGYSSGGSLVFDVALSRPHLFAGAAVICGHAPDGVAQLRYNAQYLPFYVVDATKNRYREKLGPRHVDVLQQLFEYWIPKQYPCLMVEYQGRGFETFPGEIPTIIDFLSRKKRSSAMPELGKADIFGSRSGQEFRSTRPSAKRFYWITGDDLKADEKSPAKVAASWDKNTLRATIYGMKKARIWLNASMVNFETPVEIKITGPVGSNWESNFKRKLEPSLGVLLEDYYQRGDSKNLYVQYVDFTFSK